MQHQPQQPRQVTKPPKERPLDTFIPTTYMALLEGTLLANGDLKGSWRRRREDQAQNDFCMILVGRGLYDGGFNVQVAQANSSAPSVLEIPDKWHSFEWMETTQTSCNVWGRGQNKAFGEFFTIGVHDPRQRRIVIYKVCEEEMRRAQAFARAEKNAAAVVAAPVTTKADPAPAPVATVASTAMASAQLPAPAALPAAAAATPAAAAAVAVPVAMLTRAATGAGRRKRPRGYADSILGDTAVAAAHAQSRSDIVTAAAMLMHAAAVGGGGGGNRGGSCCPRADVPSPESSDGDSCGGGGRGSGGSDTMSVEGSGGGPALGGGRTTTSRPVAKMPKRSTEPPLPVPAPVPIPTETAQMRPASGSLPGFSGRFDDESATGVGGARVAHSSVDELADLSILGARLQKEKLRIQETARARRRPLVQEKERFQAGLLKAKEDEAVMLRAIQELRKKMAEDEQQLESASQRVQSVDEGERHAMMLWNHKWETQVAPFIAQCEQGVKKKAQELDKKTREAQQEREELERELQRLQSVKQIGDVALPTNLRI